MKFWKKEKNKSTTNPFESDTDSQYSRSPTVSEPDVVKQHTRYSKPKDYAQDRRNLFDNISEPTKQYGSHSQEDTDSSNKLYDDEEDQEVAHIQTQIRNVKQDSLASTRNALQKISEAEAAATNTMGMLGTQSCKFDIRKAIS